uniref:Uncharacterized protein n=1 Tax=Pseudonaja textilis TaxID=8673 RepID=A0A670ZKB9_PSETE
MLPNQGSTPPGITAPAVPSIPSPIGVNGFTGLPPQANGQPAAEAVFANGIHPYPAFTGRMPFLLPIWSSQQMLSFLCPKREGFAAFMALVSLNSGWSQGD